MLCRQFKKITMVCMAAMVVFTGCGKKGGSEEEKVILEQEQPQAEYTFATVGVDNIVQSKSVRCVYEQLNDESLSFQMGGKIVNRVYVKEGDHVEAGQLLAVLNSDSIDANIADMEYRIARNELLIKQEEEKCEMNIKKAAQGQWWSAQAFLDACEGYRTSCRYRVEDLSDDLEIQRLRLNELKNEKSKGSIYAGISGEVTKVKDYLEGSTAVKDETVIKIIDNSRCVFATDRTDDIAYFEKDGEYTMNIVVGKYAGEYKVVPFDFENWGKKMFFTFAKGNEETGIDVGTVGEVTIILDHREGVLVVPSQAIHYANEKAFVYVVGTNGIREVNWIETGIEGKDYIEVVSGLNEGDKVIVK